jgi:hypothetical protein
MRDTRAAGHEAALLLATCRDATADRLRPPFALARGASRHVPADLLFTRGEFSASITWRPTPRGGCRA